MLEEMIAATIKKMYIKYNQVVCLIKRDAVVRLSHGSNQPAVLSKYIQRVGETYSLFTSM